MKLFLAILKTMEVRSELIAEAFGVTFVFGSICKSKKNSAHVMRYGIAGSISTPAV